MEGLRGAIDLFLIALSAPLPMQKKDPTRALAEAYVNRALEDRLARLDADNVLYYLNASRHYDPETKLNTITASVLWINSADDFIDPPELGIAEHLVTRMAHARFILLPISDATRGHRTYMQAAVWKNSLVEFLRQAGKNANGERVDTVGN